MWAHVCMQITAKEDDSHIFFRTNGTNVVISEEWVLPVPVANPHTLVSFTFQAANGDISFSMVFIGLNGEEEILIPPSRLQSDEQPVHDSVTLEAPGTLILLWDNSYSWLHKKELSYSLQIEQVGTTHACLSVYLPGFSILDLSISASLNCTLHYDNYLIGKRVSV